jgi:hypothetical protein
VPGGRFTKELTRLSILKKGPKSISTSQSLYSTLGFAELLDSTSHDDVFSA